MDVGRLWDLSRCWNLGFCHATWCTAWQRARYR